MKVEIYEYQEKRYAVIEERTTKNNLLDLLRVDYLIFLESAFYYDYKVTTFDKNGECFSLSCLMVIAKKKKHQRLIFLYQNRSFEIFENEKSTYLVLDAPCVLNKYKDHKLNDFYILKFYNEFYMLSFNEISEKELLSLKRKKKFNHYLELKEDRIISSDVEYFTALIIKEYLYELLNKFDDKKLNMKCLFQRNLLVEINAINYLYKSYLR